MSSFSSLLVPQGLLQPFPQTPSCVAGLLHHSGATGTFGTDGHVWRVLSTKGAAAGRRERLSRRPAAAPLSQVFQEDGGDFFSFFVNF